MEAITVEIPEFATFTEAAQWVADELRARGAESFQWDDRIRYKLPSGAKVEATTLTKSAIAVMPTIGDTNGISLMKPELQRDDDAVARRIRLALMRAHRRSQPAARRHAAAEA